MSRGATRTKTPEIVREARVHPELAGAKAINLGEGRMEVSPVWVPRSDRDATAR